MVTAVVSDSSVGVLVWGRLSPASAGEGGASAQKGSVTLFGRKRARELFVFPELARQQVRLGPWKDALGIVATEPGASTGALASPRVDDPPPEVFRHRQLLRYPLIESQNPGARGRLYAPHLRV